MTDDPRETAKNKRAKNQARNAAAREQYREALHKKNGIEEFYAPLFDPNVIIEDTWFRADQKGKAQEVTLLEYDYASDNPFDFDTIIFQRKLHTEPDTQYVALGAPILVSDTKDNFPITVVMPADYMNHEGDFDFRFRVEPDGAPPGSSPPTRMILDWTPPSGAEVPGAVIYPFGEGTLIDSAYLAGLPNDELAVTVPPYSHRESTDKIIWAWLSEIPDGVGIPPHLQHVADLLENREVRIPTQVIQDAGEGDGRCYFVYILFDKALNWSRFSDFHAVAVSLRTAPGPVQDPLVPQADGGLLYADIAEGIEVWIPSLANFEGTDKITVKWGNTELPTQEIGYSSVFPIKVPVPNTALRSEYPGGTIGVKKIAVSYRVSRGTNSWPSGVVDIDVDFSTVGPTHPDWPDPANKDLPKLTVKPFSGNDNEIVGEGNYGKPAAVEFELYQPALAGEIIQLYWNNVAVAASYTVLDNEASGELISLPVTWDEIEATGDSLSLPVAYSIRAATGQNELRSANQPTKVLVVPILLAAPSFPQVNDERYINCDTIHMDHGRIWVDVPADARYLHDGTEVTVHWRGFERADLSDGLPPHAGPSVPASDQDITLVWTSQNRIAYVEPAQERLYTLHGTDSNYGFCNCFYSIVVNGQTITSAGVEKRVSVGTPNGLCPLPTPRT